MSEGLGSSSLFSCTSDICQNSSISSVSASRPQAYDDSIESTYFVTHIGKMPIWACRILRLSLSLQSVPVPRACGDNTCGVCGRQFSDNVHAHPVPHSAFSSMSPFRNLPGFFPEGLFAKAPQRFIIANKNISIDMVQYLFVVRCDCYRDVSSCQRFVVIQSAKSALSIPHLFHPLFLPAEVKWKKTEMPPTVTKEKTAMAFTPTWALCLSYKRSSE